MLRGLPASGKSTEAQKIMDQGGNYVRLNRDLLREMFHFGVWSGKHEGFVVDTEKQLALIALSNGQNVIIDDTNLTKKHEDMWKEVAKQGNAKFEIMDIETPYLTCLYRDTTRQKQVGAHVILRMALMSGRYPVPVKGFVICDIDGTIANIDHRLHYVQDVEKKDWKSFFKAMGDDKLRVDTWKLLNEFDAQGYQIIFVSARPEDYRQETEWWLDANIDLPYAGVIMRASGDKRPDTEVREQIYDQLFAKYPIHKVIDDRPSVIRMWQSKGLDVIDVGKGVEF